MVNKITIKNYKLYKLSYNVIIGKTLNLTFLMYIKDIKNRKLYFK